MNNRRVGKRLLNDGSPRFLFREPTESFALGESYVVENRAGGRTSMLFSRKASSKCSPKVNWQYPPHGAGKAWFGRRSCHDSAPSLAVRTFSFQMRVEAILD
jgi:hypothetical protein